MFSLPEKVSVMDAVFAVVPERQNRVLVVFFIIKTPERIM
ncbi:hypothetical protein M989_01764 [Kluyvera georgiana ATCC 51603]|uniref:Uncharacterized protein n=1 Tax=Kluyvera georgiana ATCC 51603 TaxID=1354264 RepID=A0A1B7K1Y4_9ENTR|nr:hypothetical protein M989_01764 [Kluyvera georgiana ATCC 51603]